MPALFIAKQILYLSIPMTGFMIGSYFDHQETLRMTMFRDKSALYGRTLKDGEAPSWP